MFTPRQLTRWLPTALLSWPWVRRRPIRKPAARLVHVDFVPRSEAFPEDLLDPPQLSHGPH